MSTNNEFKAVERRYERSEDVVSKAIVDQTTAIVKQFGEVKEEVKSQLDKVKEEVTKVKTQLDLLKKNTLIGFVILATMLVTDLLKIEPSKVYTFVVGLFLKLKGV